MPKDVNQSGVRDITTKGDISPGVVMGNFTVTQTLTPASIGLKDAFKVLLEFRPSDRGHFVSLDDGRKVFINGCKLDLRIGNGGTTNIVLRNLRLSVEVEEIKVPIIRDKERGYGRAYTPHQLFIDLHRESAPGWWLISDGMKHSDPRPFVDAGLDLLDSPQQPRLQFQLAPGELEVIEGGITPRSQGLFRVRFVFGVINADETLSRKTGEILITQGAVQHGLRALRWAA